MVFSQLGNVPAAVDDINQSLELEPSLIDAYWQRHLVNVLLNRRRQALEDLNMLLHLNKSHVRALKSRSVSVIEVVRV